MGEGTCVSIAQRRFHSGLVMNLLPSQQMVCMQVRHNFLPVVNLHCTLFFSVGTKPKLLCDSVPSTVLERGSICASRASSLQESL